MGSRPYAHSLAARPPGRSANAVARAEDAAAQTLADWDPGTGEHSDEVVLLAEAIARRLTLDERERQLVRSTARLHDIGKVAVPAELLLKPGPLDGAEWDILRRHTIEGEVRLRDVPGLDAVARAVRSSHERWDGGGYPDGLRGEEIPIASRVVFCADAYHAIRCDRPYRKGRPADDALDEIRANAESQFDPRVVDALHAAAAELSGTRRAHGRPLRLVALLSALVVGGGSAWAAGVPVDDWVRDAIRGVTGGDERAPAPGAAGPGLVVPFGGATAQRIVASRVGHKSALAGATATVEPTDGAGDAGAAGGPRAVGAPGTRSRVRPLGRGETAASRAPRRPAARRPLRGPGGPAAGAPAGSAPSAGSARPITQQPREPVRLPGVSGPPMNAGGVGDAVRRPPVTVPRVPSPATSVPAVRVPATSVPPPSAPPLPSAPVRPPSVPSLPATPVRPPAVPSLPATPVRPPAVPSLPATPVRPPSVPSLPSAPVRPQSAPSLPSAPVRPQSAPSVPPVPALPRTAPAVPAPAPPRVLLLDERSGELLGAATLSGERALVQVRRPAGDRRPTLVLVSAEAGGNLASAFGERAARGGAWRVDRQAIEHLVTLGAAVPGHDLGRVAPRFDGLAALSLPRT